MANVKISALPAATLPITTEAVPIVQGGVTKQAPANAFGTAFNITPDMHLIVPTGIGLGPNDEFETGSVIDTSGARYSGAIPWTAMGLSTGTNSISQGSVVFLPALTASRNFGGYSQPVTGTTFTYTVKMQITAYNGSTGAGIFFATASGASGKIWWLGYTGAGNGIVVQKLTNNTTFSANAFTGGGWTPPLGAPSSATTSPNLYFQIAYNGTNLTASVSLSGVPGTFALLFTEAATTFLGGAPALVGFGADNESATVQTLVICDWWRQAA